MSRMPFIPTALYASRGFIRGCAKALTAPVSRDRKANGATLRSPATCTIGCHFSQKPNAASFGAVDTYKLTPVQTLW